MARAKVIPLVAAESSLDEEARTAAQLVKRIRAGDTDAETEMVQRYSRGLTGLLTRRVTDVERAHDLLQETFCVAIMKLRDTDIMQPERLAGYLRGIAIKIAMSDSRRRKKEPCPMEIQAVAAIPDQEPRPFQHISRQQRAAAVRELLNTMRVERDRELLIRYYLYDHDKPQICEELGLSDLHFNRVLYRAKKRFREILESSREFGSDD